MLRHIKLVSLFLVIELIYWTNGFKNDLITVNDCGLPLPVVECLKENGKVVYIRAELEKKYLRDGSGDVAKKIRDNLKGIEDGDDAGHLLAKRFGGTGKDLNNFVPLNSGLNRGKLNLVDNEIHKAILASDEPIKYQVWPQWDENSPYPDRPTSIIYKATKPDGNVIIDIKIDNPLYKGPLKRTRGEPTATLKPPNSDDTHAPKWNDNFDNLGEDNPGITLCILPAPVKRCVKKNNRVIYLEAELTKKFLRIGGGDVTEAVRSEINKVKADGDESGHLIANSLGGSGNDIDNVVPLNLGLNRGYTRTMEGEVFNAVLQSEGTVIYEVWPKWDWDSPNRPTAIKYKATKEDGTLIVDVTIPNPIYTGPVQRKPGTPKATFAPPTAEAPNIPFTSGTDQQNIDGKHKQTKPQSKPNVQKKQFGNQQLSNKHEPSSASVPNTLDDKKPSASAVTDLKNPKQIQQSPTKLDEHFQGETNKIGREYITPNKQTDVQYNSIPEPSSASSAFVPNTLDDNKPSASVATDRQSPSKNRQSPTIPDESFQGETKKRGREFITPSKQPDGQYHSKPEPSSPSSARSRSRYCHRRRRIGY